ncbi:MAG: hypothetical protein MAG794_00607 [Gammaproteobacteria bacterium]|nr:hypothetical protein [Gammaproteobacteria bacterium]
MSSEILEAANVESFFHESITDSVSNQNVDVCDETVVYITQLLTQYVRSEELFERDEDGVRLKPLAILYCKAAAEHDRKTRCDYLKKLGDLALFVSGWFAYNLERRRVGLNYYVQMGECAYDWLRESCGSSVRERVFAQIFQDLSMHFAELRDAIFEIHISVDARSNSDLLGLYELWQRSGSSRAAELLRSEGIDVLPEHGDKQRRH